MGAELVCRVGDGLTKGEVAKLGKQFICADGRVLHGSTAFLRLKKFRCLECNSLSPDQLRDHHYWAHDDWLRHTRKRTANSSVTSREVLLTMKPPHLISDISLCLSAKVVLSCCKLIGSPLISCSMTGS